MNSFLLLEGVFSEETIADFPNISPAVNQWFFEFVRAFSGMEINVISHPCERMWPFGRFSINSSDSSLHDDVQGATVGYLNLPFVKNVAISAGYRRKILSVYEGKSKPDCIFTFNDSPATEVAKWLGKKWGVPWVYIAGDGLVLPGADAYIYQNWTYYLSAKSPGPKFHFDGLIPEKFCAEITKGIAPGVKSLMYMGALSAHGGCEQLANAFTGVEGDFELWIIGRGVNHIVESLAEKDSRIKLFGFVSEDELHELALKAYAFANPRPVEFAPNSLNFPSKLLHYFSYRKPVISTVTAGLSPDYMDVVIKIDDSASGLSQAVVDVLNMDVDSYNDWCNRISVFSQNRSASSQLDRLITWLNTLSKSDGSTLGPSVNL